MRQRVIEIGENGLFSDLHNSALTPFTDGINQYKSVLHSYYCYLATYAKKRSLIHGILRSNTAEKAQYNLGYDLIKKSSTVSKHKRHFDIINTIQCLRCSIALKIMGNDYLINCLIMTNDATLVMMSGSDIVSGAGKSRNGLNLSGIILMEIRDYINNLYSHELYKAIEKVTLRLGIDSFPCLSLLMPLACGEENVESFDDINTSFCSDPDLLSTNSLILAGPG